MRIANVVASLLLGTLAFSSACSLTAPDGKGDAVHRCATVTDCPDPGDNRYAYSCVRAEGQDPQSQQVCEPRRATVKCNIEPASSADSSKVPEGGEEYVSYLVRIAADLNENAKGICPEDKLGKLGCPPDQDGKCSEGKLTKVGDVEFCSEEKSLTVPAGGSPELAVADIRDQFCRWYFCSESAVCNRGQCVPCDPSKSFENGGCRTMYRNGEISPVQVDVSSNCNDNGKQTVKNIASADRVFGSFPPAP